MNFYGENKYLTSIKLVGRSARCPTQEISQALLISNVFLEDVELAFPPSVLATLPLIIRNPSNLKYNRGIPANRETIESMIDLVYYQPDVFITLLLQDGTRMEDTFPATATIRDVCANFVELSGIKEKDLILVRQLQDGSELSIPLCNMPIGLFYVEDAHWSIELRFLPTNLQATKVNLRMLKLYLLQRCEEFTPQAGVKESLFESLEKIMIHDERALNELLNEIHTNDKYFGFVNRTFSIGEINVARFSMNRDGNLIVKINSSQPKFYDPCDMVIKKNKDEFAVKLDEKVYYVPSSKFEGFYRFVNHVFMTIWEAVPKHTFDFNVPGKYETRIPRVFKDSRANHIKGEYLQRVIEEQIELGKKLATKK